MMKISIKRSHMIMVLLLISTLSVYWKAGDLGFVNYDDPGYVTQNPHVTEGLTLKNVCWAFTKIEMSNWHPVTWISHMADCQFFGLDSQGHHLTNVFLHIVNTLLLFVFLNKTTGMVGESAFVAALFALHPVHVESVAWVSERKDVLSTLFILASLLAYSSYIIRPCIKLYGMLLFFYALSLMSKPMFVTFPFFLLLIDYWPLKRYQNLFQQPRIIIEKIPLSILSLLSILMTIHAQNSGGSISSFTKVSMILRFENAILAYTRYIIKTFWPTELVALYPFSSNISPLYLSVSLVVLSLISIVAYRLRRNYSFIIVGWLWFLGVLLPVIGLIQVGSQAMADRYTYFPLIGIFIILAWGGQAVLGKCNKLRIAIVFSAYCLLLILSIMTWFQIDHWRNSIDLFTHALKYTKNNYVMHNNLGLALAEQGEYHKAIREYESALIINPNYKLAHYNLGIAMLEVGDAKGSINHYQDALHIDPNDLKSRYNLAIALLYDMQYEEAILQLYEILSHNPNFADVHKLLGIQLAAQGRLDEALVQFSAVLKNNPESGDIHYDLGIIFASQGKVQDAKVHFSLALHRPLTDAIITDEVKRYFELMTNGNGFDYLRKVMK